MLDDLLVGATPGEASDCRVSEVVRIDGIVYTGPALALLQHLPDPGTTKSALPGRVEVVISKNVPEGRLGPRVDVVVVDVVPESCLTVEDRVSLFGSILVVHPFRVRCVIGPVGVQVVNVPTRSWEAMEIRAAVSARNSIKALSR